MKKRVITILIIVALILAAVMGIFHRATRMVFCNLTAARYNLPKEDEWSGGQILRDVPYADVSPTDTLDLYIPDGVEAPQLFVMIHGGGFILGDSQSRQLRLMLRYFRDRGYACASINYRLADEAPFPAAIEDCKAAIRFLRANADTYGYDAERMVVYGESAGGYLATMCSVSMDDEFNDLPFIGQTAQNDPSARVDVLINYYGHTSLAGLSDDLKTIGLPKLVYLVANNWMLGRTGGYEDFTSYWLRQNISEMTPEELARADIYHYIDENQDQLSGLSVWTIHGDADITVPLPVSERLHVRLMHIIGANSVLRIEPDMGHASDPLYSDKILNEVDGFIRAHLYAGEEK